MTGRPTLRGPIATLAAPVAAAAALTAFFGTVAGDSRWLATLGGYITRHGSVPDFVPYASAPSDGWHNVPVLGELTFHGLEVMAGDRGLLVAQVVAVVIAFVFLGLESRAASEAGSGTIFALILVILAAFAELVEIRAQLFSLALFPILLTLLRSEARRPSRRIWLVVPLLALWSNLHGAVLVGLAVTGAYLLVERARRAPIPGLFVLAAACLAIFATPALWRSGSYYASVLDNEAAHRHIGLWERLSPRSGLDDVFVVCAVILVIAALRTRPRLWELVALAGLIALTAETRRAGVWLVFFAAPIAVQGLRRGAAPRAIVALPAAVGLLVLGVVGLVHGPRQVGAGHRVLDAALREAAGTPVLATDLLAEQVVLAGGRVWIGNPIDAFDHRDQRLYVDWLQGRPVGDAALAHAPRVVLAQKDSKTAKRLEHLGTLRELARDDHAVLYVRR